MLSSLIDGQVIPDIAQLKDELKDMVEQYVRFTKNFSDSDWYMYESLDYDLVHKANAEYSV